MYPECLTWPRCNVCDIRTNPNDLTEIPVIQDDGFLYTFKICSSCDWEAFEGTTKESRLKHFLGA